jgi:hypothetical protein
MARITSEQITKYDEKIARLKKQRQKAVKSEKAKADKAKKQRLIYRAERLQKIAPHLGDMTDWEYENYISKVFAPEIKSAVTQGEVLHDEE